MIRSYNETNTGLFLFVAECAGGVFECLYLTIVQSMEYVASTRMMKDITKAFDGSHVDSSKCMRLLLGFVLGR